MKTKISALLDGELDADEVREVCIAMRHDSELRDSVKAYALIGDALRHEPHLATDITGAVFADLAGEPVMLAPRGWNPPPPDNREWRRPLLAMAAMLAGVAVVAWLGLSKQPAQQVALQTPLQSHPMVAAVADGDMQEYLIAHQIHSGSIYLNSEAQHIRTVSMNGVETESR